MAQSYDVFVYILYDHPVISFGDRTEQSLQRPCRDRTETAISSCSHPVIFTTPTQKSYEAHAMSLQVPYDYLMSLGSFFGPR